MAHRVPVPGAVHCDVRQAEFELADENFLEPSSGLACGILHLQSSSDKPSEFAGELSSQRNRGPALRPCSRRPVEQLA